MFALRFYTGRVVRAWEVDLPYMDRYLPKLVQSSKLVQAQIKIKFNKSVCIECMIM